VHGTTISLEAKILAKNDLLAERNRGWFAGRNILALNLVSSPGSGKTTLLERTIRDLKDSLPINVIEGDQETVNFSVIGTTASYTHFNKPLSL
jgi:hydrogenase nickel incorporation protein HypB